MLCILKSYFSTKTPFRLHSVGKTCCNMGQIYLVGLHFPAHSQSSSLPRLADDTLSWPDKFVQNFHLPWFQLAARASNLHFQTIPTSEIPSGLKREATSWPLRETRLLPGCLETNQAVFVFAGFHEISGLCARLDGDKLTFRDTFSEWHAPPTCPGMILATTT